MERMAGTSALSGVQVSVDPVLLFSLNRPLQNLSTSIWLITSCPKCQTLASSADPSWWLWSCATMNLTALMVSEHRGNTWVWHLSLPQGGAELEILGTAIFTRVQFWGRGTGESFLSHVFYYADGFLLCLQGLNSWWICSTWMWPITCCWSMPSWHRCPLCTV